MSHRVAVVTTGGTIGSVFSGHTITANTSKSRLRSEIARVCQGKDLAIEVVPALEKMSEDMSPADWLTILETIRGLVESGHKSILITHGTDTMAYTAAAIALYFNDNKDGVKICLTGASYPIEHNESDAGINLEAAFDVVVSEEMPPGVYLAFRANDTAVGVYHGLEITPISYDAYAFGAMYGNLAALYSQGVLNILQPRNFDITADCGFPAANKLKSSGQSIYQAMTYPGMDLSIYSAPPPQSRLIIIDAYHSGTASSEQVAGSIIDFKNKNPHIDMAMACVPSKYMNIPYPSTLAIMKSGVYVYNDFSPLVLYVLAVCRFAAGVQFSDLLDPVSESLLPIMPTKALRRILR